MIRNYEEIPLTNKEKEFYIEKIQNGDVIFVVRDLFNKVKEKEDYRLLIRSTIFNLIKMKHDYTKILFDWDPYIDDDFQDEINKRFLLIGYDDKNIPYDE